MLRLANVITEAMSFKCPVVAFDCDYGPSEIIKHYYNGILVKQGNKRMLTQEMLNLIKDDKLQLKLSINAYKRAQDFKVDSIAKSGLIS